MKIVVAGSRGGIGRVVTAYLQERGHDVVGMQSDELDLRVDIEGTRAFLARERPDAVVHLAGSKPPAPADALYGNNTSMTYTLLEAARLAAPQARHLVTSSAAVYGDPPSSYGISKRITESLAMDFKGRFGLDIIIARPFNVTSLEGDATSVIPQLVRRMRAHTGGPFPVRDRGAVRDFVDVTDVARIYEAALTFEDCPPSFDVGTGKGTSIGRVAEMIAAQISPGLLIVDDQASGLVITSIANTEGLRALGVAPKLTQADQIISKAIDVSRR